MTRGFKGLVGLALGLMLVLGWGASGVGAQDINQIKLTEKQVQGFIAAQKDLTGIAGELQAAGDKPDAKLQSKLEDIAKKQGFATFAELDDVAANISLVMAGLDPQSGEFSDPIEMLKKEMEEIKADNSIPAKDKKQMLEELAEALKTTPPLKYSENIAVVKKHREAIEKALQ
jgi:hypothetical protein